MTTRFPPVIMRDSMATLTLTCETDSSNPATEIQWRRNAELLNNSDVYSIKNMIIEGDFNATRSISSLYLKAAAANDQDKFTCFIHGQEDIKVEESLHLAGEYYF